MHRLVLSLVVAVAGAACLCSCSFVSKLTSGEISEKKTEPKAPAATPQPASAPAPAPAAPGVATGSPADPAAIQVRRPEKSGDPVIVELAECTRKDGILTMKLTLRNPSARHAGLQYAWAIFAQKVYFVAQGKKYFLLRDTEGVSLQTGDLLSSLGAGEAIGWWGKFPAPPAEIKKVDLFVLPEISPFEEFPIADR